MNRLLLLRRAMIAQAKAEEGLGDYTKAYVANIVPDSTTSWTITHNMGILPRVVHISMIDQSDVAEGYVLQMVIDLNAPVGDDGEIGMISTTMYTWNSSVNYYQKTSGVTSDITTIVLSTPYSTARSKFHTGKTYHVEVYG